MRRLRPRSELYSWNAQSDVGGWYLVQTKGSLAVRHKFAIPENNLFTQVCYVMALKSMDLATYISKVGCFAGIMLPEPRLARLTHPVWYRATWPTGS